MLIERGAGVWRTASVIATDWTRWPVAFWTRDSPGPSLNTTRRGAEPSTLRVSCLNVEISRVWLMIVVLLTITVEGRTCS